MRPFKDILGQAVLAGVLAGLMGYGASYFIPLMDYFWLVVGLGTFVGNLLAIYVVDRYF